MPEGKAYEQRISGLLAMLHDQRVQDRLAPLIESRRADPEHLQAWKQLRNSHVHPKKAKLKNITTADHQRMADLIAKTTILLYHITFVLIGFEGPYADYGTVNWLSKYFPFKEQETPPPG
jgi:hypothetical protein